MLGTLTQYRVTFSCFAFLCFVAAGQAYGQFTTIYNVPPDVAPGSIGSDTQLNLYDGGSVGPRFEAGRFGVKSSNLEVNIFGGYIATAFTAYDGSTVNISGGSVSVFFGASDGSTVNISGGSVGDAFRAFEGSTVNISGGSVGDSFDAYYGTAVNISGGSLGNNFDALHGSTVDISGGTVDGNFTAHGDSTVNISGGSLGENFHAFPGSTVDISGGTVDGNFTAFGDSTVNISGGSLGEKFQARSGSTVNISGGTFDNTFGALDAFARSTINLFGRQFVLDDMDITPSLTPDFPFTINDRDVSLTGLLADGSPFAFDLFSIDERLRDFFHPGATLTVTLVSMLLAEDTNGDGMVNIDDLNNVRNHFGAVGPDDGTLDGDAYPFDGLVNIDDLNAVRNNFGAVFELPVAVPEPGSLGLLLAVLTATLLPRRLRLYR